MTDPRWDDFPDVKVWRAFMAKWSPNANVLEGSNASSYAFAFAFVQVLKQCGEDLTRENPMRQAANIIALEVPTMLPGIEANTRPANFHPLQSMQLARFEGDR